MDVAQLLHKLMFIAHIEIVIALLPEVIRASDQVPRDALLQRFDRIGERAVLGFVEKQMNVLRHDDIAVDPKSESISHTFEPSFKCFLREFCDE